MKAAESQTRASLGFVLCFHALSPGNFFCQPVTSQLTRLLFSRCRRTHCESIVLCGSYRPHTPLSPYLLSRTAFFSFCLSFFSFFSPRQCFRFFFLVLFAAVIIHKKKSLAELMINRASAEHSPPACVCGVCGIKSLPDI